MKRFFVFLGALFIMQTVLLFANDDIVWTKQTHDVKYVQFSPDGTMIATNNDGQVLIHDVVTKETLHEYNPILKTRFTPDGKYIVGYYNTNELIVIDVATWQKRDNIQKAPSNIRAYDFSKDGKKIIASYSQKYEYSIWDIESGQIEKTVQFPIEDSANSKWAEMYSIFYGKDDRTVIFTTNRAIPYSKPPYYELVQSTHIVDAMTNEQKFKMNKTAIINLSNDKSIIADRFGDESVAFRVVDANNWDVIFSVPGIVLSMINEGNITFSPDDKYVIAGYGAEVNKISVYEILSGKETYTYKSGTVDGIDASKDSKYIASGNGPYLHLFKTHYGSVDVKQPETVTGFKTFPNPTNTSSINFEFDLLMPGITKIQLYDLTGRIVKNIENKFLESGHQRYKIDLKGLINGQYNLIIETLGRTSNHKIIVNR